MNSVFLGERYDDRTLIKSIVSSFFIIDYGFIKTVNPDKTIDVTHAKQLVTLDGKVLPPTITKKVEVLSLSCKGFSVNFDYAKGDQVLLLGLKDYVEKVKNVTQSEESKSVAHYNRETLKAIPLCVFNENAKVVINIQQGNMDVACSKFTVSNANGEAALEVTP